MACRKTASRQTRDRSPSAPAAWGGGGLGASAADSRRFFFFLAPSSPAGADAQPRNKRAHTHTTTKATRGEPRLRPRDEHPNAAESIDTETFNIDEVGDGRIVHIDHERYTKRCCASLRTLQLSRPPYEKLRAIYKEKPRRANA